MRSRKKRASGKREVDFLCEIGIKNKRWWRKEGDGKEKRDGQNEGDGQKRDQEKKRKRKQKTGR